MDGNVKCCNPKNPTIRSQIIKNQAPCVQANAVFMISKKGETIAETKKAKSEQTVKVKKSYSRQELLARIKKKTARRLTRHK